MKNFGHSSVVSSYLKKLEATGFKFYCVGCHRERLISVPAKAGSVQFYIHALLSTGFLMLITWPFFNWKGIVWALPVLLALEFFYRLKMRSILVCPDCQFDPILYMVNRDKAVHQVDEAWRKKFEIHGIPYPERRKTKIRNTSLDGTRLNP